MRQSFTGNLRNTSSLNKISHHDRQNDEMWAKSDLTFFHGARKVHMYEQERTTADSLSSRNMFGMFCKEQARRIPGSTCRLGSPSVIAVMYVKSDFRDLFASVVGRQEGFLEPNDMKGKDIAESLIPKR